MTDSYHDQMAGSLATVFHKLNLNSATPDISKVIAEVKNERIILQEIVPLYKSLEWELAGGVWENLTCQRKRLPTGPCLGC